MKSQQTELTWWEGRVPVSTRFDDPYYNLDNGLAETRHVFLNGNGLPDRFKPGFQIGELGFGTGLNFLTTVLCWDQSGQDGTFTFTSFEAFPMAAADMAYALAAFPELTELAQELLEQITQPEICVGGGILRIIEGDARGTLPEWAGRADAWFLDGFSPAKNPELWEPTLLQAVADHSSPGTTAATYSAAGHVRRALEAAGFAVTRTPGFGRKRHMVQAVLT